MKADLEKVETKINATPKPKGGRKPGAGRKKGTPNKATREIRDVARQWGPAAIKEAAKLAGLTDNGKFKAASEQARISALNVILDRAYGKAAQLIQGNVDHMKGGRTLGAEIAAKRAAQGNEHGLPH